MAGCPRQPASATGPPHGRCRLLSGDLQQAGQPSVSLVNLRMESASSILAGPDGSLAETIAGYGALRKYRSTSGVMFRQVPKLCPSWVKTVFVSSETFLKYRAIVWVSSYMHPS